MIGGTLPVGCGQCLPCRVLRKKVWADRIFLESLCHDNNCWATLTYEDSELDHEKGLRPDHLSGFIKRLRARWPTKLRFFGVGEYGSQTLRPHYHVALFGVSVLLGDEVSKCWPYGFTSVLPLEQGSAEYLAKYTLKHMTFDTDWRLDGYAPEFMRCSNRPGIGAPAVAVIAEKLKLDYGYDIDAEGDVPKQLKMGRRSIILGRYLRSKLRTEVGLTPEYLEQLKQEWVDDVDDVMFPLRMASKKDKEGKTAKQLFVELNMGKIWSVEARAKLRDRRKL